MVSTTEQSYVLGNDESEVERLGFQHRAWGEQAFALWDRVGFGRGQTILDLGCGPGFTTLDLAHIVGPTGRVIAVDASESFIARLREQVHVRGLDNVECHVATVEELELAPESLDGAFTRWLFCFLPDPESLVTRVAQALRPGGVFAVQDYYNGQSQSVAPRSEAIDRALSAMGAWWRSKGGDPDVAGRLPGLFAAAGLDVREILPHVRAGRPGSLVWDWMETAIESHIEAIVADGLLTSEEREAFEGDWARRRADPNSFFCSPPVIDVVGVKSV
jgi:SAM-dependent methyltransferase